MSVSIIVDLYSAESRSYEAPNALCTLVKREEVSDHDENCQQNTSDLEGSLITSSEHRTAVSRYEQLTASIVRTAEAWGGVHLTHREIPSGLAAIVKVRSTSLSDVVAPRGHTIRKGLKDRTPYGSSHPDIRWMDGIFNTCTKAGHLIRRSMNK